MSALWSVALLQRVLGRRTQEVMTRNCLMTASWERQGDVGDGLRTASHKPPSILLCTRRSTRHPTKIQISCSSHLCLHGLYGCVQDHQGTTVETLPSPPTLFLFYVSYTSSTLSHSQLYIHGVLACLCFCCYHNRVYPFHFVYKY